MKSTLSTFLKVFFSFLLEPSNVFLHNFILEGVPQKTVQQYDDNLRWLREAEKHKMVVGSQARILYSDQEGRVKIALAFNQAVKDGKIKVNYLKFYSL